MAMTITLFKNSKVNGNTRLGKWESLIDQVGYFESLEKITEDVQTVVLGSPVRLNKKINQLLDYNYGSLDYGDGFKYYFSVVNLEMVSETMTNLYYNVDAYETLVMQKPFTFKRATIKRHSQKIGKSINPYTPTFRNLVDDSRANYNYATLFYIRRDDTNADMTMYGLIVSHDNINHFFDGTWFDAFHVQGTSKQIVTASVMPGIPDVVTPTTALDVAIEQPYDWFGSVSLDQIGITKTTIKNDGLYMDVIKDMRGLDVFIPEENTQYTINNAVIGASASTIKLILFLTSETLEQRFTTISLENVMIFSDNYQEYLYRQRGIDIDTRNLNMNKELTSGLIQTAGNMITGCALGPAMGVSKATAGANVGAGGLISTLGNYGVNAYFSPMEQELTDRQYKYMNDGLTLVGDFSYAEYISARMGLYTYTTDASVNYANDIDAMGYYTEIVVQDFTPFFVKGPIMADIEIEGVTSQAWLEQIRARFNAGVMVV